MTKRSGAPGLGLRLMLLCFAASCGEPTPLTRDPLSGRQTWLTQVRAVDAWRVSRGDPSVIVAVLDNGADLGHPDLRTRWWTNTGEVAGNGLDDDGDGFIDDVNGVDLLDRRGVGLDPRAGVEASLWSHATAVAGIIAAETDNDVGVAGGCPRCRVMVIRARDFAATRSSVTRLSEAVDVALRHGARVLNVSDGLLSASVTPALSIELAAAVARAERGGLLVVASAGNDGAEVRWPARVDGVLAVAAVDDANEPASWTSFGREVGVSAPGVAVYTTLAPGEYGGFDGTSASAPVVSALAGLLFARHPEWTPRQVATRIRETARPLPATVLAALREGMGSGVVDYAAALRDP